MADSRLQEIQQELASRSTTGSLATSSDDGDRLQDIQQELSKRQPSVNAYNLFQIHKPTNQSLIDMPGLQKLRDPKELGKATMQAVGTLGMAAVPEFALLKGAGMSPSIINSIARIGAGGTFGAMSDPNAPVMGAVLGAGAGAIKPAIGLAGKAIDEAKGLYDQYLNPEIPYNNLMNKMFGGNTISQNIQELSHRLKYGQSVAKTEALTPKRELKSEYGEQSLFPSQVRGEDLTQQAASLFADHPDDITPDKLSSLQKEMKTYYNGLPSKNIEPGDLDRLVEKGENIFNSPGLSDDDVSALEDSLIPAKPVKGSYLKIDNADQYYSGKLQDAHDNYVDDPTFSNSDTLRSRLFKRINELNNRQKMGTITDNQEKSLESLTNNRNAIINDQNNFIKTLPPEYQQKYGQFNKLWAQDVSAYNEAGKTIKNLKNGYLQNITPQKITNAFSFPELNPQLQKVLSDIGPSGINNIVYNSLGRTSSANEAVNMLNSLEKNKGFAPYMTPEINALKQNIQDTIRRRNIAKWGTTGVLGAGGLYEAVRQIFGQ